MLHPVDQICNLDDYPYPSKKELLKIVSDFYDGKYFYAFEQGTQYGSKPIKLNVHSNTPLVIGEYNVRIGDHYYGRFTDSLEELYEFAREKILEYKTHQLETLNQSFKDSGMDIEGYILDKKLEEL